VDASSTEATRGIALLLISVCAMPGVELVDAKSPATSSVAAAVTASDCAATSSELVSLCESMPEQAEAIRASERARRLASR
jgi:F420-0:gamma-glutamyl ligase